MMEGLTSVPSQSPFVLEANHLAWFWKLFVVLEGAWVLREAGAHVLSGFLSVLSELESRVPAVPLGNLRWDRFHPEAQPYKLEARNCELLRIICTSPGGHAGMMFSMRLAADGQSGVSSHQSVKGQALCCCWIWTPCKQSSLFFLSWMQGDVASSGATSFSCDVRVSSVREVQPDHVCDLRRLQPVC